MLDELLEVLIDGGQGKSSPQRSQPPNPWVELLEDVIGGEGERPANPQQEVTSLDLDDLLGMVLKGGRQGAIGGNPLLAPFTNALAERLGLSPQMASAIVSAAFGVLTSYIGNNGQSVSRNRSTSATNGLNLDDLLDGDFLEQNGITDKVARQTGMEKELVEQSLMEAFNLLGVQSNEMSRTATNRPSQSAGTKKAKKSSSRRTQSDLKHLLDDWDIHG